MNVDKTSTTEGSMSVMLQAACGVVQLTDQ